MGQQRTDAGPDRTVGCRGERPQGRQRPTVGLNRPPAAGIAGQPPRRRAERRSGMVRRLAAVDNAAWLDDAEGEKNLRRGAGRTAGARPAGYRLGENRGGRPRMDVWPGSPHERSRPPALKRTRTDTGGRPQAPQNRTRSNGQAAAGFASRHNPRGGPQANKGPTIPALRPWSASKRTSAREATASNARPSASDLIENL